VIPSRADLLITRDCITHIDTVIEQSEDMEVIDCSDTIISPGFVDTHHHPWQSQQMVLHADQILLDYYHSGMLCRMFGAWLVRTLTFRQGILLARITRPRTCSGAS
jgi:N-acetylglucosamine-6-phosphate deacetylase